MKSCFFLILLISSHINCFQCSSLNQTTSFEFMGAHQTFGQNPLEKQNVPDELDSYVADSNGGVRWHIESAFSVANVTGGEPNDIVNYAYTKYGNVHVAPGPFSDARIELYGDGMQYVGCGINALYSELEYFSLYGHFDWLGTDDYNHEDYKGLAKYVIQNTNTIPIGENIFIWPSSIRNTFDSAMSCFGYNNILTLEEGIGTPNAFINSINQGYPIIWGCALDGDIRKSHYLVVYGYEYWTCVDSNGIAHTQIMFKTHYNWFYYLDSGQIDYYIHLDMFNYINVALYPKKIRNHYIFKNNDITNECYYPYTPVQHNIVMPTGNVTGTHLRTGYVVDNNNDHFLTMSAKRSGAGVAQIVLNFPESISEIYWKYSFWSSSEQFNFSTDSFVFEGQIYEGGPWKLIENLPLYLITTHREHPDRYHKVFSDSYVTVRLTLTTSASGSRNKGRVVLSDVMAFGACYIP